MTLTANYKKRARTAFTFLLTGLCLALVMQTAFIPMSDPDNFWHIKNGEWIAANKTIPYSDHFSWYGMENGFKWTSHEWLYDLLSYGVFSLGAFFGAENGGFTAIRLMVAVVILAFFFLTYALVHIKTKSLTAALLIAMISARGLVPHIQPRPQIFSFCLFIVFMILMEKKKYAWGIPVIIIGTNLHGGVYPVYLALGAYYLLQNVTLKRFIIYMALFLPAVLINPYGFGIYMYTIKSMSFADTAKYINEWKPTVLFEYKPLMLCLAVLPLLLKYAKVRAKDIILLLGVYFMALKSARHMALFYIISLPAVSPYICETFAIYNAAMRNDQKAEKFVKAVNNLKTVLVKAAGKVWLPVCAVSAAACLLLFFVLAAGHIEPQAEYPYELVNYVRTHPEMRRIFNDYNIGGYFIFNDIPVFIDGRQDLYTPNFNDTNIFTEYSGLLYSEDEDYGSFFEEHRIDYIILGKGMTLSKLLKNDSRYPVIFETELYFVFRNDA
jgi:hypothetical protein